MEIEKKLKEARANAGLTQEQVAEKIMVSRQTISIGKMENPCQILLVL